MDHLVAFDFDGTLSDSEMTVLLGAQFGVADRIRRVTERAMNDEIGYAESLRERASLLEGLPESDAETAYSEVRLRPGAAEIIGRLRAAGTVVAILTGGFERGVEHALEEADVTVDAIVANRLPVQDGQLRGTVDGPLVEGTKDTALARLVADEQIPLERTTAVGDGANDLPMLEAAGLAVGYAPNPAVEPAADVVVTSMTELMSVLERHDVPMA